MKKIKSLPILKITITQILKKSFSIEMIMGKIWTITIKEKILLIRSSYQIGQSDPKVANQDDGKVIFKIIDYAYFAILTSDEDSLKLYIVNAKTGKVLFQDVQNEVDLDQYINLVFDDHKVFVTYQNQAKMIFEIWTVEIYHMKRSVHLQKCQSIIISLKIQQINIIMKQNTILFSNSKYIDFLQQVYGFPLGIKYLGITRTRKSLTKKNLLIITTFSQMYQLDRNLVSARRRENSDLDHPFVQLTYRLFNMNSLFIFKVCQLTIKHSISKGFQQNLQIQNPMPFLSFMVLTIITPYKSYDMVQKNFNYDAVILTTVLITLTIQVSQKLIKSSKQVKQFKVN
ncbi:unnamed protein product (macronuclear) [Paramecium tetraurelia]|uniref:ER membrane protein complex subunit 1 n=1 Tax=Paramecium tetraurelia TaxID=5888 RepID=A0E6E8_PARTE|nr:uncharacterized protein GSPATT00003730001 [Paramecium tetraurelia]CAK90865.1 unnamed protein product [Paramecium tetraurelia]|eukprot:XP_001458262.1 hypothetical protein (macronuclear) [Paramecium tetraurelia strain d4-2]